MHFIEHGFNLEIEVLKISSIATRKPGSFRNSEGETVSFGYSIKFRTSNIFETEDDDMIRETENIFEVEIVCEDESQSRIVAGLLRDMRNNGVVFRLPVLIPNRGEKGFVSVKSVYDGKAFLERYQKPARAKEKVA